jgi:Putative quorum-sensing-regulated virulence factor
MAKTRKVMTTNFYHTMPFGRYRGHRLVDLPDPYLTWLLTLDLRDPLRTTVHAEARRRGLVGHGDDHGVPDRDLAEAIVDAGRRTLARRHHPDIGGHHDQMVAINNVADWLIARVRELHA